MKRVNYILSLLAAAFAATACYDPYVVDYPNPNMGFSLGHQVRTVVESKSSIYVGVAIGGKREVDLNDWAHFTIEEGMLAGTGKTLLPEAYYTLANANTFKVRREGLAVADVEVRFTDAFYDDPLSLTGTYALPLRMTDNSIGAIREGADSTIVAVKYINEYSGTWYKMGTITELDASGSPVGEPKVYGDSQDVIYCPTAVLKTVGRYELSRPGYGNLTAGTMKLTIENPGAATSSIKVEAVSGMTLLDGATATLRKTGDYTFFGGDNPCPQIDLDYTYVSSGKNYLVKEKLVLRNWAENELRIEVF